MLSHPLGECLECDAADIEFGYNLHGKPRLIGRRSPLEFNVSYSIDAAVFAFSRAGAVGAVPADTGYVGALAVRSAPRDSRPGVRPGNFFISAASLRGQGIRNERFSD